MHVLVLKKHIPNSSYGLSKIATNGTLSTYSPHVFALSPVVVATTSVRSRDVGRRPVGELCYHGYNVDHTHLSTVGLHAHTVHITKRDYLKQNTVKKIQQKYLILHLSFV